MIIEVGTSWVDIQRQVILETLRHCHGNRVRTSRVLGIAVKTVFNKIREYRAEGCDVTQSRYNWPSSTKKCPGK
jgi:two-component system, response regulator FlrC